MKLELERESRRKQASKKEGDGVLCSTSSVIRCTDCEIRPSANWQAQVSCESMRISQVASTQEASRTASQASSRSGSVSSRQTSRSSRSSGSQRPTLLQAGKGVVQSGGK